MRNRSGQIDLATATLPQLEAEIARLKVRLDLAGTRSLQKAIFDRMLDVGRACEQRFAVERPDRVLPARRA